MAILLRLKMSSETVVPIPSTDKPTYNNPKLKITNTQGNMFPFPVKYFTLKEYS